MIRKIFLSSMIAVALMTATFGQDQRTRETKIADIVMQMPANNTSSYNRLMAELSGLDPIPYLTPLIADPGGNDAQIREAIGGLAMYASRNAALKAPLAKALDAALTKVSSDEKRDFLLIQLQYVAGDESVSAVTPYLSNARLCDAACRVLVRIGTDNASKTLLASLPTAAGAQKTRVVQALGELRCAGAADAIGALATGGDANLTKAALYSLSRIAAPASAALMKAAAARVGYIYEPTDALASYLRYLENLKDKSAVAKYAKELLKATSENTQVAAKTAALRLVVTATGEKAIGELTAALKSSRKDYRVSALNFSQMVKSPKMYAALMKVAQKEKDAEKLAEIIRAFGQRHDMDAVAFIKSQLTSTDTGVRGASMVALATLQGEGALQAIIQAMNTSDEKAVQIGKNCLLSMKSSQLPAAVAAAIPQASQAAKVAFLDILASRKAEDQIGTVYAQTASTDAAIRLAADNALASIAGEEDVQRIAELLNKTTQADEKAALQKALYGAVSALPQDKQTALVAAQLKLSQTPEAFYNVLAMIGGRKALVPVESAFGKANDTQRDAAFEALTKWKDESAIHSLYNIASTNLSGAYFNRALTAYVGKTVSSKNTPEQKLLMLRKALAIARTADEKAEIVKQIGQTRTFLGFIVSSKYLDDSNKTLQQAAVQAVRITALAHRDWCGDMVSGIIRKAIAVNKDPEADYQKAELQKLLDAMPNESGFVSMFNGKDLTGWKGLVENPIARAKMTAKQLAEKQKAADEIMRRDWKVEKGLLVFEGKGFDNLCSAKDYGDFEMYVDWKIAPQGDAGIYLRGTPQVQIWDVARTDVGAQVGSGGLYNNQKAYNPSKPLVVADNPVDEWNSFYIKMIGEKVTVYLNGQLVTDNVTLENFWDRSQPIFAKDAIELQAHGTRVEYRDIYIHEIPRPEPYKLSAEEQKDGFVPMFNGIDMSGWVGNLKNYYAKDGEMVCDPSRSGGSGGNIYTDKEYSNFIMRFEFQLTPAANNGLGIRTPLEGDAAYVGMELQILDNEAEVYKNLRPYQYCGSVYGVIPAKRGYLKPTGEWNTEEVVADGNHIKVTLNGTVILDGDIAEASKNFTETMDHLKHPGLSNKSGHIGFLGHGSTLAFRNLRIKDLSVPATPAKPVKKSKK